VGHGYYDLITPYLASKYVIARMALDPAILENLRFEVYEAGHMYYSRASARTAFLRDIRDFFEHALTDSD
jgi:carboxypeptidase C (cathepsin A)